MIWSRSRFDHGLDIHKENNQEDDIYNLHKDNIYSYTSLLKNLLNL